MRLKSILKKDMNHQYNHNAASGGNPTNSTVEANPSLSGGITSKATNLRNVSNSNMNTSIGSIGDYILTDLLLGDVDLDLFVRVETHYIRSLLRRVFNAWNHVVEETYE